MSEQIITYMKIILVDESRWIAFLILGNRLCNIFDKIIFFNTWDRKQPLIFLFCKDKMSS